MKQQSFGLCMRQWWRSHVGAKHFTSIQSAGYNSMIELLHTVISNYWNCALNFVFAFHQMELACWKLSQSNINEHVTQLHGCWHHQLNSIAELYTVWMMVFVLVLHYYFCFKVWLHFSSTLFIYSSQLLLWLMMLLWY